MLTWATSKAGLGIIAFATQQLAQAQHPDRQLIRCNFGGLAGLGWLALDRHGSDNDNTVFTPDGRQIPVVAGWCEKGHLIGIRGLTPLSAYEPEWRAIMNRVVQAGLDLHEYKLQQKEIAS